jgi:nucleoside-diphosphate-sugar epimerase
LKKIYRKDLKGKNVLLIGGSGFIGSHLAEELVKKKIKKLINIDN